MRTPSLVDHICPPRERERVIFHQNTDLLRERESVVFNQDTDPLRERGRERVVFNQDTVYASIIYYNAENCTKLPPK